MLVKGRDSGHSVQHLSRQQLESGLDEIRRAPKDNGVLNLIVRRPETGTREILETGKLEEIGGLHGDNWLSRGNRKTSDGGADPEMQLNIMNSRVIALVAQQPERWHLAGDQLFLDMDLSKANLPIGTRLAIGSAIIEVTAPPHTGCKKFVQRFGLDAMVFVNSGLGSELCLRGICAKVVQAGTIRVDDVAKKLKGQLEPGI
jgi:hypothetical protein